MRPGFRGFQFDKEIIREVVAVGLPSTIGQSGASLGFIVLNGFIGSYGTATIAAYAMVNRITSLVMQPAMGMGSALTAIVGGQNVGAGRMDRVQEAFRKALALAIAIGVVGSILLVAFDYPIITFFMQAKDDPSVIDLALTYLFFIFPFPCRLWVCSVFSKDCTRVPDIQNTPWPWRWADCGLSDCP